MPETPGQEVTSLLAALRGGEEGALTRLVPLVYDELRKVAAHRLAGLAPGQTLQATALVHEAYLKLDLESGSSFEDRAHFFGAAARAMRNVMVDAAREKGRLKRGGGWGRITLSDAPVDEDERILDLLGLDEALTRLEEIDSVQHEVVLLRYFSGLSIDDTAQALGLSPRTVDRHWRFARVWLKREMTRDASDER